MEDNMWSRKELKSKAKEVLRRGYLSAFGVSIVITLADLDFQLKTLII